MECIFTLFGFKLLYPDKFFMSRGKEKYLIYNIIEKLALFRSREIELANITLQFFQKM